MFRTFWIHTVSQSFLHIMEEWKNSRRTQRKHSNFRRNGEKKCFVVQSSSLQRRTFFFSFCCSVEKFMTAWHEELIRVVGLLDDDCRVGFVGCSSWVLNGILWLAGRLVLSASRVIRKPSIAFTISMKVRGLLLTPRLQFIIQFESTTLPISVHIQESCFSSSWIKIEAISQTLTQWRLATIRAYNICARKERKRKLNNRNL